MIDSEMMKDREDILKKYNQFKEQLGHQPSYKEFIELSGINNRTIQRIFGSNPYSKLVKEAGDEPNIFFQPGKSIEDLLIIWGNMVRKLGKVPTESDWLYNEFRPGTDWYRKKFGSLLKIPEKFSEFTKGKKEWEDVLSLLPKPTEQQFEAKDHLLDKEKVSEQNMYQFLPPLLHNLYELGSSEGKSIEFEKKVNSAFQMLGFEVRCLGQGSGRNPDGIACDKQNHYAIIYDAKSRKDGYSLGTDDRTIIEYIKAHRNNLLKDGLEKVYFLIVSNRFNIHSKTTLNRIVKATGIPVVLVRTEDLLTLVSGKIRNPHQFDLGALQDIFIESGELDQKKVRKFADENK